MENQNTQTPAPVPSTNPAPPPTLVKNNNLLIILFSFLVLILLASTAVLAYQNMMLQKQITSLKVSPTPSATLDVTAKWKTYTDPDFSFKYPSEMNISTSSAANVFYLDTPDFKPAGQAGYEIQITKMASNIQTIDQFMQIAPNTPEQTFLDKQSATTINGNQAVVRTYQGAWSIYKKYYVYSPKVAVIFEGTGQDHSTLDQIISTFQFTVQGTSASSTYKYGTFSFSYPNSWTLTENTTNPQFFSQNNLSGFDHMVLLQNGDFYLLIGIDTHNTGAQVGGIFTPDADYQNYLASRDQIKIGSETFLLSKDHTSLTDWNGPGREAGIYGLASLAKYVPNKVTNQQGQTFNGSDDYFQENGNSYMFIKLSKTGTGAIPTPTSTQNDIISILESIKW
jgi:hypothetical protein